MKKIILFLFFNLIANAWAGSTNTFSLPNAIVQKLQSKINGVHYKLFISLPKNYNFDKKHYPIIYLLDADYSFALAKQIGEHLSDRNRIKESILVGLAYSNSKEYKKNRTRDYTPSYVPSGGYGSEYQKYSGGAEKFYQFIHKELIPYLRKNYRVQNNSTFVGHSFGGLFGVYLLINHPHLFNNYIIVSPSLWYDNNFLLKMARSKQDFNLSQSTKVCFIIGGQENKGDYRMVEDLTTLSTIIGTKPHKNLYAFFEVIKDMDHDTVFPTALTKGLLKIMGNYSS
ncbi:MAG: alpha/beta hydrolase [Tatlockia sp.]|nr:alpha/beta hydrolase [Tatlockia sp.]